MVLFPKFCREIFTCKTFPRSHSQILRQCYTTPMAPLYKRYLPPKQAESIKSNLLAASPLRRVPSEDESTSRKRLRTEEEVSQRKSKRLKLKAKETSRDTAKEAADSLNTASVLIIATSKNENGDVLGHNKSESRGEFAHIKNAKKRHKLEKEARKARKIFGESGSANGPNDAFGGHSSRNASNSVDRTITDGSNSPSKPLESQNTNGNSRTGNARGNGTNGGEIGDTLEIPGQGDIRKEPIEASAHQTIDKNTLGDIHRVAHAIKPTKRRHKLESILEQSTTTKDTSLEDQAHLQKHSAVLGKFQKSARLGRNIDYQAQEVKTQAFEAPAVRDLTLPEQDDLIAPDLSADAALPRWLARPIVVSSRPDIPMSAVGLGTKVESQFTKLGFKGVLPVQRALIPLLLPACILGSAHLPGTDAALPDIAVSAPTGSGKTIAYLLPVIEALKDNSILGELRALVVVPTRELVTQVAAVGQALAKGTDIKIGTATGAGSFQDEVPRLVNKKCVYNPSRYRQLMTLATQHSDTEPTFSPGSAMGSNLDERMSAETLQIFDAVRGLADHVSTYESAVDILIATPGRLLEHIRKSHGFSLSNLQWLVLDEADKLLDQKYDGLLSVLHEEISKDLDEEGHECRPRHIRLNGSWRSQKERRVRKIMLSATMTKDVAKLAELNLRRPQLIVVNGTKDIDAMEASQIAQLNDAREVNESFELPPTLCEYSVHAGDGTEKPLLLIELLRQKVLGQSKMRSRQYDSTPSVFSKILHSGASDSNSETESHSSSSPQSQVETDAESEANMNITTADRHAESEAYAQYHHSEAQETFHPDRLAMLTRPGNAGRSVNDVSPTVLIFTSSTESANRLSYLLKNLQPDLADFVATMTRSSSKSNPHPHAKATDPIITISTDRAGRGIDAIGSRRITHVIQYDVPRSSTSYIHRVGRTARAGQHGEAWTLFTHSEARWFMNEIIRAKNIKRSTGVEKVKLNVDDLQLKEELFEAVAGMRDKVFRSNK